MNVPTGLQRFVRSVSGRAARTLTCFMMLLVCCAVSYAQPSITGFLVNGVASSTGPVGATLTIQGSGFGATQGFSTATLNGIAVAGNGVKPNSWSDSSIVVVIPSSASSGPVVVKVSGKASNAVNFAIGAVVTGISPGTALAGNSVTITGNGFGTSMGTVTFNGMAATCSAWADSSIVAQVPNAATSGPVVVTVNGQVSNGMPFTPTPSIGSLSPNYGLSGASVTIAGNSFGNQQGSSTVSFSGVAAAVTSWSNTSITATAPSGALTGNVVVTVNGVAGSGQVFTYIPNVAGLSPNSGLSGTQVTITGTEFGNQQGSSTVTFNGVAAAVSSWSNTSITATAPSGALTGNVVVTVNGVAGTGQLFTFTPTVGGLSPNYGLSGTQVTITGTEFGNQQGSSTVTFSGVAAAVSAWNNTSITATAPSGALTGSVVVTVNGVAGSGQVFTYIPTVASLSPVFGLSGTQVTVTGSQFGAQQGSSTVTFSGVAAAVSAWSNTSITATAPSGALTGNVVVTVNGVTGSGQLFTYTPQITGLSPNPVLIDTVVAVQGTNFGPQQGSSTVTFNGVAAAVTSWNNTTIGATVPGNASPGPVVVTVNGVASNGFSFSFPAPYSFKLSYAPNGDVLSANDSVNGNWSYTYDDFDRLAAANNSSPQQGFAYAYDQYGNRWQQNLTAGTGGTSVLTFTSAASASSTGNCYHAAGLTNQPDGYCYDASGNLLSDGQHNYTYDAENRIIAVDAGQTATYAYDAHGNRVQKVSATGTAAYLYDLGGQVVTQLDGAGNWTRGEVYAGGQHLATYGNGGSGATYLVQADWLGTERTRLLLNGDLFESCASLPFGDGLTCNGSADPSPNHLTGQPRDLESNLDYFGARYYSSAMGRFVTPDWAAKAVTVPYADFGDPQSLNLYAYVRNNPLKLADKDGHDSFDGKVRVQENQDGTKTVTQGTQSTTETKTTDENGNVVSTTTTTTKTMTTVTLDAHGDVSSAKVETETTKNTVDAQGKSTGSSTEKSSATLDEHNSQVQQMRGDAISLLQMNLSDLLPHAWSPKILDHFKITGDDVVNGFKAFADGARDTANACAEGRYPGCAH